MVPLAKFDISLIKKHAPRVSAILYRKLAEVSYDFFLNFTCAHKHSRQRSYKKITEKHGKLKEFTEKHGNLCGGESPLWLVPTIELIKILFVPHYQHGRCASQEY